VLLFESINTFIHFVLCYPSLPSFDELCRRFNELISGIDSIFLVKINQPTILANIKFIKKNRFLDVVTLVSYSLIEFIIIIISMQ